MGTSSWTFPGWAGLVYEKRYGSSQQFTRDSLAEYARHRAEAARVCPVEFAVGADDRVRPGHDRLDVGLVHRHAEHGRAAALPAGVGLVRLQERHQR